jgi:hypothetical protein
MVCRRIQPMRAIRMSHTHWQHRYCGKRRPCTCLKMDGGVRRCEQEFEVSDEFQGNDHWLGGTTWRMTRCRPRILRFCKYGTVSSRFSFLFLSFSFGWKGRQVNCLPFILFLYRRQNIAGKFTGRWKLNCSQNQVRRRLQGVWFNTLIIMFKCVIIHSSTVIYLACFATSTHLCCVTHVRLKMKQTRTRPVNVFGPEWGKWQDILSSQASTPVFFLVSN